MSVAGMPRLDKEVFEVQAGFAAVRREVVEEQREADGLALVLREEHLGVGRTPKRCVRS